LLLEPACANDVEDVTVVVSTATAAMLLQKLVNQLWMLPRSVVAAQALSHTPVVPVLNGASLGLLQKQLA
jgi:hypothetical protein